MAGVFFRAHLIFHRRWHKRSRTLFPFSQKSWWNYKLSRAVKGSDEYNKLRVLIQEQIK